MTVGITVNPNTPFDTSPHDVKALGMKIARVVLTPDDAMRQFVLDSIPLSVKTLFVVTRETFLAWDESWTYAQLVGGLASYRSIVAEARDLGLLAGVEVGNEPDLVSDSSWTMAPSQVTTLVRAARDVFGSRVTLVGPGCASGEPSWLRDVDLTVLDVLSCHPYGKRPRGADLPIEYQSPETLDALLDGYLAYGKPLWITEFGAPMQDFDDQVDRARYHVAMLDHLRRHGGVPVALAFCYEGVDQFQISGTPTAAALASYAQQEATMYPGHPVQIPQDVKDRFDAKVPLLYPGVGDPWPLAAGPYAGSYIYPGHIDGLWHAVYTYGLAHDFWGEVWAEFTPNQPAAVAAGLNVKPF